jgi:hypothetical protein
MNRNLNDEQFGHVWKRQPHPDEDWRKAEISDTPHGRYIVTGDGYGRMRWAVTYPDGDGMNGDSRAEVRANADLDLQERQNRSSKGVK